MRIFRSLSLVLCLGSAAYAADPAIAPDTIEARAQGCSTCHGSDGQGTADSNFPRIAGKPKGYLFNQLKNFRDGQRSYPPMNYLIAYMDDDYLREFAAYFALQPVPERAAVEATPPNAIGKRLVLEGDPARGVPACVLCHGSRLNGIEPGIPALVGLNSRYIAAQLVSWRVGTRRALDPDCMHEVATRLSEEQVRAVASWLATRAPTEPTAPAAQGLWTTPLPCGSEP